MKYLLSFSFFLLTISASAQQGLDSLSNAVNNAVEASSALEGSITDTVQKGETISDSTVLANQNRLDSVQVALRGLDLKLDSILQQGADAELVRDSLMIVLQEGQKLEQQLLEKQQVLSSPLSAVSEAQQAIQIQNSDLPVVNLSNSELLQEFTSGVSPPLEQLPSTDLPTDIIPPAELPTIPDAAHITQELPQDITNYQLPDLGDNPQLQEIQLPNEIISNLDSSSLTREHFDRKLEEQLLERNEVTELQQQIGVGDDPLKEYLQQDARSLANEQAGALAVDELPVQDVSQEDVAQQLPKKAVDHFTGKEAALEKARGDLNKHKGRFNEIKSFKELPKNPLKRHPLMGVKWYKRIQPGLHWQIGVGDAFRVDIGPRISYLVTDRLELGASYQERFSVDKALPLFVSFRHDRVYGYNLFGSYEIKKGFYGQISYERLNTRKLMLPSQQEPPQERVWLEGFRLGIGKRYTLYKRLRCYSLIEYSFNSSLHSPYRQQLQVKVGLMWGERSK